jgi:hypothetical protein
MSARIVMASVAAVLAAWGCRTTESRTASHAADTHTNSDAHAVAGAVREAEPVKARTEVPTAFAAKLPKDAERWILVPVGMVSVAEVSRPRAEVRSGPGTQFELADKVLAVGTPVLTFEKVGVWRKVVAMRTSQTGWVHEQALTEPQANTVPMRVDARRLPTVLAIRDVKEVQAFPDRDARAANVPRGAMFRTLRYEGGGTLVWLPETASVMWMSRKDVQ